MDSIEKKGFLVTWDFTGVSENALDHAIQLGKAQNKPIELLHVIEKGTKVQDIKKKEKDINDIAKSKSLSTGLKISGTLYEGSIFSSISEYINQQEKELVFMGTHGIKGMQKVMGSWALKVLIGSKAPFIVVQDAPSVTPFQNIISPVDFRNENKEKISHLINLAKTFKSKVILFEKNIKDKSLNKRIGINTMFAVKYFIKHGVDHEVIRSNSAESFAADTMKLADKVKSGLIAVTTTKHISITDYMFGADEQAIIANPFGVPVLCVNPLASFAGVGQFMYG